MKRVQQQGFVLISVLLIVALIGLLATTYVQRHHLALITSAYGLKNGQMQQHLKSAESYTLELLAKHATDSLRSEYNIAWQSLTDEVNGEIRLISRDGLFNINNVLMKGPVQQQNWQLLQALLGLHGIKPSEIAALDKIVQASFSQGYQSRMGWVHPQELFDLAGVSLPHSLRELLVTLPASHSININVAPPGVIKALLTGISADQLDRLLLQRKVKLFDDVNEFLRAAEHAGYQVSEVIASRTAMLASTQFRFYELDLTAQFKAFEKLTQREKSLIQIHDNLVQVLARWRL